MFSVNRRAVVLGLAMLGGLLPAATTAQTPSPGAPAQGPLRLIVPFTPGTGIDLIARTVGPKLGERLGRPVVVDNRAGA
ncbi:MAG: tripartite tricarboxylate transporter substrate binding protein, partial [Ramlibacter sp.]